MRTALIVFLVAMATPALAQFPPPGIYQCTNSDGLAWGSLSLLVAGDYQFDRADGTSVNGQISSAGTSVEALTGPLADQHWRGEFSTEAGATVFVFETDSGKVSCR